MSNTVETFVNDTAKEIKNESMNNAVGYGYQDTGFTTIITNNEIKSSLNKTRLRDTVVNKVKEQFSSLGYDVKNVEGGISVYAPPLLEEKESYTLEEIRERNKIKNELEERRRISLIQQQLNA